MAKTRSRQEIEVILKNINKVSIVEDTGLVKPTKYIAMHSYVDKGVQVVENHCHACGHMFVDNIMPSRYYRYCSSSKVCPTCGNNESTASKTNESKETFLMTMDDENGFKFIVFKTHTNFDSLDNEWYKKPATVSVIIKYTGLFDQDKGWFVYDVYNSKLLKRDCNDETHVLDFVKKTTPISHNTTKSLHELIAEANLFDVRRKAANETKKANSKATVLEELRGVYRPHNVEEEFILNASHTLLKDVYSTKNGATTYMICCTKCGHVYEAAEGELGITHCPSCDNEVGEYNSYARGYSNYEAMVYENTSLPENDLLVRVFDVRREFSIANGFSEECLEMQRIFFGKKVSVYNREISTKYDRTTGKTVHTDLGFKKRTIRDIRHSVMYRYNSIYAVQENEEIAKVIKNSCLMYSGMLEAYGLGDSRYKGYAKAPDLSYIMTWYKKPAIELVMKANMTNLLEDMIRNPDTIGSGKTLAEALMVHPHVAKMAVKMNISRNMLSDLNALYDADKNITTELFTEIENQNLPAYQIIQLRRDFDIDYNKTLQYLQSVYDNQCIEKRESIGLWIDYLRMAKLLKIDLTDKTRKFPGSLKKEHDVATFAYRAIQIDIDKEKFRLQAEQNACFEYTYKDLMVVVPKTPQDIVEEATRQRNCLRSYVERVKNGDTVVVFIRRKIMPDATYVTAEVHNGRLLQLKGYCNSNPRNKELVEFVQHWAKAKGIRVEC